MPWENGAVILVHINKIVATKKDGGEGGGVLARTDYIRRLCPEGAPFSGSRCIER